MMDETEERKIDTKTTEKKRSKETTLVLHTVNLHTASSSVLIYLPWVITTKKVASFLCGILLQDQSKVEISNCSEHKPIKN